VILQEQYRQRGIDLRLRPLEFNVWMDRARTGQFDAIIGAWQIDLPPGAMRELWGRDGIGGSNYGAYASQVFDSLVAAAVTTPDAPARAPCGTRRSPRSTRTPRQCGCSARRPWPA